MVKPNEDGEDFSTVPTGSSMDTFDDTLNSMDGTDPADNLSPVGPKSTDDGFPKAKEFQEGEEAESEDGPVEPSTDEDDDDDDVDTGKAAEGDDAGDGEYTEGDRLKELGHDYESIEDYTAAVQEEQQSAANAFKEVFAKKGVTLSGNTPTEIAQELSLLAANAPAESGDKSTTSAQAPDDISQAIDGLLKEYSLADDAENSKFYRAFGEKIAAPVRAMQQHMIQASEEQALYVDKVLYMEAAAAAKGDAPIPSFSEARRMLQANPKLREDALYRERTFGSGKENPFTNEIFATWAAKKNAVGLTNQQVAAKQAGKKAAKFSKQTSGGRSARTGSKSKSNVASEIAAMRKLPASILERSR